jgi:hypothetical protein
MFKKVIISCPYNMEVNMNIVKELEIILEEAKSSGEYFEQSVSISMMRMDRKLNKIIENFVNLSKEQMDVVGNAISNEIAWLLLNFATNMVTYSLRGSEQRYFSNGLMSLRMIFNTLDQREIILVMALFYDASKRNKLSFKMALELNDEFSDFVLGFLNRREEDKTLESMGYTLSRDQNNHLIYKRMW